MAGACAPLLSAAWNPQLAADYLDSRQKDWFAWKTAQRSSGACFSCHTNLTYFLARPALRKTLGESAPTQWETSFADVARKAVAEPDAKLSPAAFGVETVFAALLLGGSPDEKPAFERFWAQQKEGAWTWFSLDLDPWEMPESNFFGAAVALMAVQHASPGYRQTPDLQTKRKELATWLTSRANAQPLHNQTMLLIASAGSEDVVLPNVRRAIVNQLLQRQQPDGSWTLESMGPWNEHPAAKKHEGADAYATALAAYGLKRGGVPASDPKMKRALAWLEAHQHAKGYWDAYSMNKVFPEDSMMAGFMRDAATSYAVLALTD